MNVAYAMPSELLKHLMENIDKGLSNTACDRLQNKVIGVNLIDDVHDVLQALDFNGEQGVRMQQ